MVRYFIYANIRAEKVSVTAFVSYCLKAYYISPVEALEINPDSKPQQPSTLQY